MKELRNEHDANLAMADSNDDRPSDSINRLIDKLLAIPPSNNKRIRLEVEISHPLIDEGWHRTKPNR